jgi:hypothetical protein
VIASEPWSALEPGESFRVTSRRGNGYECQFIEEGMRDAGLYVRVAGGRLARLDPRRLDPTSLERRTRSPIVHRGDHVLLRTASSEDGEQASVEHCGVVLAAEPTRLAVETPAGTIVRTLANIRGLRLLFRARDLRPGDEFLVESNSGRLYRGIARRIEWPRLTATLTRAVVVVSGSALLVPVREPVTIRLDYLDLETLRVLVPVTLAPRLVVARESRFASLVCAYCRDQISSTIRACSHPHCGARYHPECWDECRSAWGSCAIYGCDSRKSV